MAVLSKADMRFWEENGYVIVREAVPQADAEAVVDTIWDFMGMDRDNPASWYTGPQNEYGMLELSQAGMVELYQHQSLWTNRQNPRIYGAFVDIWGTEKLWVTIDRVNLNPPARADHDFKGFVHWDIDTSLRPPPFRVQGVLALVDVTADQGGLQLVPGFHREFEDWVKTQPADRDPWKPDIGERDLVKVEMGAGDLVIWHSLLPHGTARNSSTVPRLAQYISMFPAPDDEALRQERIDSWRERKPRVGPAFPGDPRRLEIEKGATAVLSPLGEKLLGLTAW